jgi:hypothetical protein
MWFMLRLLLTQIMRSNRDKYLSVRFPLPAPSFTAYLQQKKAQINITYVKNAWSYASTPPMVRNAPFNCGSKFLLISSTRSKVDLQMPLYFLGKLLQKVSDQGLFTVSRTALGAHPASYPKGTGASFLGSKAAGASGWPLISL